MTQTITLQLSDDVMLRVEETALSSGQSVEGLLAEWISHKALAGDVEDVLTMLTQAKELPIYTPLGGEKTAQELWEYLQETNKGDDHTDQGQP